jgi:hypothetical protein
LVREAIERHLPAQQLQVLQEAEASERSILQGMIERLRDGSSGEAAP